VLFKLLSNCNWHFATFLAESVVLVTMNTGIAESKTKVYLRAILFIVLTIIAGFFLLIAFLGGIIGAFLTGNFGLVAGGIFYFVLFVVTMFIARKFEPDWRKFEELRGLKRKTTRESIKDGLPMLVVMISALVLAAIFEEYFLGFPSQISGSLGKEILNSILTIDGIIIGLCGVVLAQFLWAIHSKGNILFEQMIINRKDKEVTAWLNSELDSLSRVRFGTVVLIFFSVIPPLASFLFCLVRLPMTEGVEFVSAKSLLYDPITIMIVGVVALIWVTSQVNLLPKKSTIPQEKEERQIVEGTSPS